MLGRKKLRKKKEKRAEGIMSKYRNKIREDRMGKKFKEQDASEFLAAVFPKQQQQQQPPAEADYDMEEFDRVNPFMAPEFEPDAYAPPEPQQEEEPDMEEWAYPPQQEVPDMEDLAYPPQQEEDLTAAKPPPPPPIVDDLPMNTSSLKTSITKK